MLLHSSDPTRAISEHCLRHVEGKLGTMFGLRVVAGVTSFLEDALSPRHYRDVTSYETDRLTSSCGGETQLGTWDSGIWDGMAMDHATASTAPLQARCYV